jgi:phosphoribosylamine--glycine ligase
VEFNCRLGDPESQVVLPRLKTDLLDAMMATAEGDLSGIRFEWDDRHCVGIVMASGGYPGEHTTGYPIDGIDDVDDDVLVFHAGTSAERRQGEPAPQSVSAGGRVLTVSGLGRTLGEARSRAYAGAAGIRFQGAFYRTDVGLPA